MSSCRIVNTRPIVHSLINYDPNPSQSEGLVLWIFVVQSSEEVEEAVGSARQWEQGELKLTPTLSHPPTYPTNNLKHTILSLSAPCPLIIACHPPNATAFVHVQGAK